MQYFWIIPVAIVAILLIWIFYGAIKSRTGFAERQDGRVVLDKPPEPPSDPGPLGPERLGLKRADEEEKR